MNVRRALAATLALSSGLAAAPLQAQWGISVSVSTARIAPPPLPVYEQPEAPGDGYIWTPGYWAWDDQVGDYFWVPGTWVMAPEPGLLWTPGYWGFENSAYLWHPGYWGQHVGFYGGVNYGFGYFGTGYEGGYWNGDRFFYNTAINRINLAFVRNTYARPMRPEWNVRGPRIAFNGGPGGINMRPSRGEEMAFREQHFEPTGFQRNQANFARQDRGQFSGYNHGAPPAAATPRPVQGPSGFRNGAAPAQGAPSGIADWNRNRGNDNRGNFSGDNRGGWNGDRGGYNDNRGGQNDNRSGYNGNRGGQNNDPRYGQNNGNQSSGNNQNNGGYGNGGYTGGGRNGFNGNGSGPAQGAPTQGAPTQGNPPQDNTRGGWNGPGDGRFRPQPPATPRMPMPTNNGGNGFNGGQPTQSTPTQGRPTGGQPVQGAPTSGGNNGGGRPSQPQGGQPTNSGGQQGNNGGQQGGGNRGGGNNAAPAQNRPAPSGMRQFERLR